MKLTQKTLALCLMSAVMLTSYGAWAQTSPSRSFSTELATAQLAKDGLTEPTPDQLSKAETSIQTQREAGMGWGQIADSLGLSLGAVVSAANRAEPATQKADNKAAATGQYGQSINANSRSDTRASNRGGNAGGKGGGNGGGGNGGGNGGGGGRGK